MSGPVTIYPAAMAYFDVNAMQIVVTNPGDGQTGDYIAWWIFPDGAKPVSSSETVAAKGSSTLQPPQPDIPGDFVGGVVVVNIGWVELQIQQSWPAAQTPG